MESHDLAKQQLDEINKADQNRWEAFVDEIEHHIGGEELAKQVEILRAKYGYDLDDAINALREIIESCMGA